MKILIVATNPLKKNGIANVIKNYCHYICRDNVEFHFCFAGIRDIELKNWFETNLGHVVCLGNRHRGLLHYCIMLSRYIRQEQFDIIHIHCSSRLALPELIAVKLAGCKVVMVHSHNTTCSSPFLHKILYFPFVHLHTHAFACGQDAGKWMFGNKPFIIVNNGVDIDKFSFCQQDRIVVRRELQYAELDKVICHVGNFNSQKNHQFLIDVFEAVHALDANYKLLLIGSGQLMDSIKSIVITKGLNDCVCFLGGTSQVEKYLNAADVVVMPSLFEGLPLSLIEEQANGLKCVVSDVITTEVDKTGNVTFVSLQSPLSDWVNAIISQDLTNRENASIAAVEKIKKSGYSIKEEANKLLSIYKTAYEQSHKINMSNQ